MPTFRIFATCDIGADAIELLRKRGYQVEVFAGAEAPPKSIILEKVKTGIDGLITTLRDKVDAEIFNAGRGTLKVVAQNAVGVDNIDRVAANRCKIPFMHTPDVLTEATAEFAFFMMGCLARKMWPSEQLVRENKWGSWHPSLPFLGDEVTGKTIAIFGTGRIGQALARKCLGFDMNILCYNPTRQDDKFVDSMQDVMDLMYERGVQKNPTWIMYEQLDVCLREADFVSLHVPLVSEDEARARNVQSTFHLMNEKTLRMMKPTAYLINTSRGAVVDEAALVRALKERWIAGAALDVYEKEPLPADSPLRDAAIADRCRLFHHFASGARATRLSTDPDVGMAGRCAQGLIDVLEKNYEGDINKMPFVVNKEAF